MSQPHLLLQFSLIVMGDMYAKVPHWHRYQLTQVCHDSPASLSRWCCVYKLQDHPYLSYSKKGNILGVRVFTSCVTSSRTPQNAGRTTRESGCDVEVTIEKEDVSSVGHGKELQWPGDWDEEVSMHIYRSKWAQIEVYAKRRMKGAIANLLLKMLSAYLWCKSFGFSTLTQEQACRSAKQRRNLQPEYFWVSEFEITEATGSAWEPGDYYFQLWKPLFHFWYKLKLLQ